MVEFPQGAHEDYVVRIYSNGAKAWWHLEANWMMKSPTKIRYNNGDIIRFNSDGSHYCVITYDGFFWKDGKATKVDLNK